jgi:hypothetical protein
MCERPGFQIESASPATGYAICIGMTIAGLIALFLGCAKRRSEQALAEARMRRESLDLQDPDYGGVLIEQITEERAIEQRIMRNSVPTRRQPESQPPNDLARDRPDRKQPAVPHASERALQPELGESQQTPGLQR